MRTILNVPVSVHACKNLQLDQDCVRDAIMHIQPEDAVNITIVVLCYCRG